jgi:hypothetical protein
MEGENVNIKEEKAEKLTLTVQEERYTNSNVEKTVTTRNWITILPIYQTCMDHEQMIRTSYQSLLTTLEVGILVLFFTLYQLNLTYHLWLLSVAGVSLCLFFGIASEYRARNVDIWRVRIVKLVSGTDVEDAFKEGKYRWIPSRVKLVRGVEDTTKVSRQIPIGKVGFWGEYLLGHWFERILVSGVLVMWLITLWLFPSPFTIRLCGVLATGFWIIYAFGIIELKGEIIPYIHRRL